MLFNKMLRYYARFIVVCLFANRRQLVYEIIPEFKENINIYLSHFNINGSRGEEWELVISELESFLRAETVVTIEQIPDLIQYRSNNLIISKSKVKKVTRGNSGIPNYLLESKSGNMTPSSDDSSSPIENPISAFDEAFPPLTSTMKISEAILMTNRKTTVKFSELTLDVFRIMQSIERGITFNDKQSNILKNMLYRPTYQDMLAALASSLELNETSSASTPGELSPSSSVNYATFLYLSADGTKGGITLNSKRRQSESYSYAFNDVQSEKSETAHLLDSSCLTIDDILPFTRKPLFMIVESDNSTSLLVSFAFTF